MCYMCKVTVLCNDTLRDESRISVRTFRRRPAIGIWPESKLRLIQNYENHFNAESGMEMVVLDVEVVEKIAECFC